MNSGPKSASCQVHVVVVDHRRARHQPRIAGAAHRIVASFGAYHARPLLCLADVQHAFAAVPVPQIRLRARILALAAFETDQIDALALCVALQSADEAPRHGRHQRRRRYRVAANLAKEVRRARAALQHRHVRVHTSRWLFDPVGMCLTDRSTSLSNERKPDGACRRTDEIKDHPSQASEWGGNAAGLMPDSPRGRRASPRTGRCRFTIKCTAWSGPRSLATCDSNGERNPGG